MLLYGNFVFDLHGVFQKYNPGVKQGLPVQTHCPTVGVKL